MKKLENENERKFLLRNFPQLIMPVESVINIFQYYVMEDGKRMRVRFNYNEQMKFIGIEYIYKENIGPGKNLEHHENINHNIAVEKIKDSIRSIRKTRYVYRDPFNGLKYEVDMFKSLNLIMLEIETDEPVSKIEFSESLTAKYLQREIVSDVTDYKCFSNFNLAYENSGFDQMNFEKLPLYSLP